MLAWQPFLEFVCEFSTGFLLAKTDDWYVVTFAQDILSNFQNKRCILYIKKGRNNSFCHNMMIIFILIVINYKQREKTNQQLNINNVLSQWAWFSMSTRNLIGYGQNSVHPLLDDRWIAYSPITWGSCIFKVREH